MACPDDYTAREVYVVRSASDPDHIAYVVTYNHQAQQARCECPHGQHRPHDPCSHIGAVFLAIYRELAPYIARLRTQQQEAREEAARVREEKTCEWIEEMYPRTPKQSQRGV